MSRKRWGITHLTLIYEISEDYFEETKKVHREQNNDY